MGRICRDSINLVHLFRHSTSFEQAGRGWGGKKERKRKISVVQGLASAPAPGEGESECDCVQLLTTHEARTMERQVGNDLQGY